METVGLLFILLFVVGYAFGLFWFRKHSPKPIRWAAIAVWTVLFVLGMLLWLYV